MLLLLGSHASCQRQSQDEGADYHAAR